MRLVRVAERNKRLLPFSSATPCGLESKAAFRKGFGVMGCAGRAIADSPRRNCRPKLSRRPSTWFVFVRCCNGHRSDSRLGPNVPRLLLLACDHVWRHDVRTKFPSRVIHTPRTPQTNTTPLQPPSHTGTIDLNKTARGNRRPAGA